MRKKRLIWIFAAAPLAAVVAGSAMVYGQLRQNRLDAALIQAIKRRESGRAIALLEAGASPNAEEGSTEPLTLPSLLSEVWAKFRGRWRGRYHVRLSAFMLACETPVKNSRGPHVFEVDQSLLQSLLAHGADPNAGATALAGAKQAQGLHRSEIVRLLAEAERKRKAR